jgi:hypothetical protein
MACLSLPSAVTTVTSSCSAQPEKSPLYEERVRFPSESRAFRSRADLDREVRGRPSRPLPRRAATPLGKSNAIAKISADFFSGLQKQANDEKV